MSLKIGDIVENKYRIVSLLGEGGMGAVFEGENVRIKRRVAIKVLHAAIASDPGIARRFQQEAQAAGHIGNEHIIEVLDLGELPNGDHFMVMEYLDGEPLTNRIKRMGRLSPEQAYPIFKQILEGLGAAHEAGILHRDLKPDNIFILNEKAGQKDFVKIIDFGISKFQPLAGEMKMTRTGTLMGTPYYMSPEQASGAREMNAQSDIYAIGVILYEALTGAVPFDAPTFNQLMFRIVLSEAAPIEALAPDLNPAFASIVKKAMAREQVHRFESCAEFIAALDSWAGQGSGVTIPPVAASDIYLPDGASAETVNPVITGRTMVDPSKTGTDGQAPAALGRTNQAWANTGPQPAATKSKAPIFLGAALAVLLAAGGAAAFLAFGPKDDTTAAAAAALSAEAAIVDAPASPSPVPAEQDEAPPPEGADEPGEDDAPEVSIAAASAIASTTNAANAADAPTAATTPGAAPPANQPPSGKKATRHTPRPPEEAKKPPVSKKKRDFGY